jgi:hypothetical protein
MDGSLVISFDEREGFIRVVGQGLWTPDYIDGHFDELRRLITIVRAREGRVLVLVDLTRAPVQSVPTADRIKANTDAIYRADDRIAAVVSSNLAKVQLRDSIDQSYHQMFVSLHAAITWLTAYARTIPKRASVARALGGPINPRPFPPPVRSS